MGANTKIQWADHTFNPWRGCTKVAAGCANCYADAQSKRNPGALGVWGPNGTRVVASEAMWNEPVKWDLDAGSRQQWYAAYRTIDAPRPRVFCASMCDVFEDWQGECLHHHGRSLRWVGGRMQPEHPDSAEVFRAVTIDDVRARLFRLIDATPNLDWLLLTKRPENIRRMWPSADVFDNESEHKTWWDNVWLGTSVATQEDANKNIPALLQCRDLAAKLFVSIEPLIEPIDLTKVGNHDGTCANLFDGTCLYVGDVGGVDFAWSPRRMIDQIIVGGESGPHARACDVAWIRSIVQQCRDAAVPCFVKQLGSHSIITNDVPSDQHWPGMHGDPRGRTDGMLRVLLEDKKGGNIDEWPVDLRVRETPK